MTPLAEPRPTGLEASQPASQADRRHSRDTPHVTSFRSEGGAAALALSRRAVRPRTPVTATVTTSVTATRGDTAAPSRRASRPRCLSFDAAARTSALPPRSPYECARSEGRYVRLTATP